MRTVTPSWVGIDVVNRAVVWACGGFKAPDEDSGPGIVVRTDDGGDTWQDVTPPGAEHLAFHDLEAFDKNNALAVAVGPGDESRIYRTADGGQTWNLVFQNQDPAAFYDGIAFFDNNNGIAVSDPVNGKFRILNTHDAGQSWQVAPSNGMPPALATEGVRATGSSLVTKGPQDTWFGTVAEPDNSRVFHTNNRGHTWSVASTPIPGLPAEFGIASLAFWDTHHGLALGGGSPSTNRPSVAAATADGGATWTRVGSPDGFRTNMAPVPTSGSHTAVAVGFTGSDITTDGGHTWQLFDQTDLRGINCAGDAGCWAVGKDLMAAELKQ
ncbi:WD40/YVTN/BNR-like repeat-containing protein [Kribbella sp. NPDC054772]